MHQVSAQRSCGAFGFRLDSVTGMWATFYPDPPAAAELTRVRTPWLVGEVEWTPRLEMEAVPWLGDETERASTRTST